MPASQYDPMPAPVWRPDIVVVVPRLTEADIRQIAHVWNWHIADVLAFIAKLEDRGLLRFIDSEAGHA